MSHSQLMSDEQRAARLAQIQARLNDTSLEPYSMYDFGPLGCTVGDAYFFGDARADVAFLLEEVSRLTDALGNAQEENYRLGEEMGKALDFAATEQAFLTAGHAYCAARRDAFDKATIGSPHAHRLREQLVDRCSREVLAAMLELEPRSSRDAGLSGEGGKQ